MGVPFYLNRWPVYAALWDKCEVRPNRVHEVATTAKKLLGTKARYKAIEAKTGVPWWVIAALHERESGARFDRQLAQGDPLHRRSTNQPISGPFDTFEDSAVWALNHDRLNSVVDWRIEKCLYWCELWNGWGYYLYHPHTPSPYLWGATTVQKPGKYVSDGVWSSTAMDTQLGVAAIFKALADLDPSIKFTRETPASAPIKPPVPVNRPVVAPPPKPDVVSAQAEPLKKPTAWGGFWSWLNKKR